MTDSLLSIPNGFMLFGHKIYFYGITSALSYLLGVVLAMVFAKKRGFKKEDILTLACYVIPLAIIGARIYYVLFKLDSYKNFVDIFKIWEGGLGFYGGLIGGALGVVLYCLIHKKNLLALADIIAPALIISQSLGRWGNFFNQEAYGYEVTSPNMQWFPFAVYIDAVSSWHLATFFYESLWNFVSFWILIAMLYRADFKNNGILFAFYLIFYGIGRAWIEGLRTDSLYLGALRVSQVLSIVFIICGVAYLAYCWWKQRKKEDVTDKIIKIIKKDL